MDVVEPRGEGTVVRDFSFGKEKKIITIKEQASLPRENKIFRGTKVGASLVTSLWDYKSPFESSSGSKL